jgi:hypothetical protein
MRGAIFLAVTLATGLFSAAAAADDTPDVVKKNGVWEFKETKIALRPPRPAAVIDVTRAVPRAPLPDLRQPLIDRIGKAVEIAPF